MSVLLCLVRALPVGVLLVALTATLVGAEGLRIVAPQDNRYVEGAHVNLVLLMERPSATVVEVTVGERRYVRKLEGPSGRRHLCMTLALDHGMNRIDATVSGATGILEKKTVSLYRRSAILKPYIQAPQGFERYFFHTPDQEKVCSGCHRMEAGLQDIQPLHPTDSPCYGCHKDKTGRRYGHKPAAVGTCFSCHAVGRGSRLYATRKPDQAVCFVCHSAQASQWKGLKVHHGPTAVGNCTTCHDPHGSEQAAFLLLHPTDLCLNCHQDKKNKRHVIAGFFAKGHPLRGPRNPLKPDRPFSCAGCHNPHAGDNQNLLNKDRSNMEVYCRTCHRM